jgi:dihydroceramidase
MTTYYWGEFDSSAIFCEDKYVESEYIAEYWNTISGIPYILLGIYFMTTNSFDLGDCIYLLGIGTVMLHTTLRWYGQWLDEISMLVLMFSYIKAIYSQWSYTILVIILVLYTWLNEYHMYLVTVFISLTLIQYRAVQDIVSFQTRKLNKWYLRTMLLAFVCWVLDRLCFQKYINFHVWWHILSCAGTYIGTMIYVKYRIR